MIAATLLVFQRGWLGGRSAAAFALLAIAALAVLLGGMSPAVPARAQGAGGIGVTYRAGWNLIGAPDGTVISGGGRPFTLGAGDPSYVALPLGGPLAGGRGYWVYFSQNTTITLSGAGQLSATVPAPAGHYVTVGNPSGVQSATVAGADDVQVWDTAAGQYVAATTLGVGQGAWAYSRAGGAITITGTGPLLSVSSPATPASATASPVPAATPAPALGASVRIDQAASTAGTQGPGVVVFEVDITLGGQPSIGGKLSGTLTFTGLPAGNLAPVSFGPDDLGSYTGETVTLKVPTLPATAQILIHAVVTLGSQTAAADATYSVAR